MPKTGDDDTLPILYSLAAIVGIGGIILFTSGKRKEQMH
ncbi:MAG: LPXTG cell wall anchor domain-containing protein [Clostridiales bacterium]|nr:LPXTG cell wall anchor domain-containing protein [Clostridiales bacterium]